MSSIILNSLNDNININDNNMKINNNDILNKNLHNVYDDAIQKTYKNLEHLLHSSSSSSSTSTASYSTNSIMIDSNSNLIDDQHQNIGDIWDHQITFEIPSNLDLERIKNLDNFTSLLHRIPSSSSSSSDLHHSNDDTFNDGGILDDTGAVSISGYDDINAINFANILNDHNIGDNNNNILDNNNIFGKWSITNSNDDNSVNSDYQMILNYLWIGIVISLIIMSIIFIVFSCYFYRKFREWKKCNKDIRAQLPNDLYPNGNMNNMTNVSCLENGYYQMIESPPCYTIATGLPSYDEALMQATTTTTSTTASQNQQIQYHNNLSHNRNNLIEQQQQQQQQQQQNYIFDTRLMTSWEKPHHIETVECNNYVWDEGNNTFETTNLVVINNLTDVISNSNIYATNNNNVSKNSNNTKEIENVSFTHTITNNSSNDINDDVITSAAVTAVAVAATTRTPATEFNYSDSDLVLSYEKNKNIEDIKENVKKQYEKNMRVENENDVNSSRIVSEQNIINGNLKDNNDRMEIVILS